MKIHYGEGDAAQPYQYDEKHEEPLFLSCDGCKRERGQEPQTQDVTKDRGRNETSGKLAGTSHKQS